MGKIFGEFVKYVGSQAGGRAGNLAGGQAGHRTGNQAGIRAINWAENQPVSRGESLVGKSGVELGRISCGALGGKISRKSGS